MNRIILTSDDGFDFLIYDLDNQEISYKQEKSAELDATNLAGLGRKTHRPFGVTYDDQHIYIASNDKLGRYNKQTYAFETLIDIPLYVNTHQILKSGTVMYTCNTAIDTIGIYGDSIKQFNVNLLNVAPVMNAPKNADQLDVRHVNTLYDDGDKILFCRHNKDLVDSNIGYFDKNTFESGIILTLGRCCHGIAIRNGCLYTLSTATGELIEVNLSNSQVFKLPLVDPKVSFLRGIDVVNDKLIIGASINLKHNKTDDSCHIISIDFNQNTMDKYYLTGIKIINDLRSFK